MPDAPDTVATARTADILIVDDDWNIRDSVASYLEREGFGVRTAANAAEARVRIADAQPDLVLLDVMMPGEDGLSLCKSLFALERVRVIIVSARTSDADRIAGLEQGADDYVCKPFNPRELVARVRAVLRRAERHAELAPVDAARQYAFDRWILDPERRHLLRDDGVVTPLSASEFRLLQVLVTHAGRVVSRDRILELTRDDAADVFDRSVDSRISRLRRKLELDPRAPTLITTVWGGGYTFTPEVRRL